ncbi:MAG TPA: PAS domain-containing protein [Phycisphaerae bacterium]|jgi:signal transduction histidine kinase|nr:PAS domain-containing protein [Phycisphaerae bacterium]
MSQRDAILKLDQPSQAAKERDVLLRYALAACAAIFAFFIRVTVGSLIQTSSPFLMFIPAVMLSAWFGGQGPAFLATAAGAVLGNYYLIGEGHEIDFDKYSIARTFVFVLVGLQIGWMSGRMRAARSRAETDAAAARRSERLYRTLACNFPDGFVCLFDARMHWTFAAGSGMDGAGLVPQHMEGRPIAGSMPAATFRQVEPLCTAALQGKSTCADISHGDRFYAAHFLPLPDQQGGIHAGMAIFEDVTERVRASQELRWAHDHLERRVEERTAELHFQTTLLESLSQSSLDGILALSQCDEIIFANRRFHEIWGLLGRKNAAEIRSAVRAQCAERQDPFTLDADVEERRLLDGRFMECQCAAIMDAAGHCYGRVWFFRDITDRRRLESQILDVGERERQRIGQDLHDDLCQQLTAIACIGRTLHKRLSDASDQAGFTLIADRIVQMAQNANQRARDLAKGLHPLQLQREGLANALQELATTTAAIYQVACQFRGDEFSTTPDDATALHLYRIAQEAISNAARHGRPSCILVDLVAAPDRLILSIEDDGTGIPEKMSGEGLGLHTMKYRAHMIGGEFTIEARQPNGTVVTVSVPLTRNSPAMPLLVSSNTDLTSGEFHGDI